MDKTNGCCCANKNNFCFFVAGERCCFAKMDFVTLMDSLEAKDNGEKAKKLVTTSNAAARNAMGYGIITFLCAYGPDDPELLRHFFELGATLELDNNGKRGSPLHYAVHRNKPNLVRTLLQMGVPINITDGYGMIPFSYAFRNGCTDTPGNGLCAKILADTGLVSVVEGNTMVMGFGKKWSEGFMEARDRARTVSVIILGLIKSGNNIFGNGKDVLRVIARCTWSSRGQNEWCVVV